MQGWIKLHRKIRINPIFNDHQLLRLWLICLTEASHKEREQIIGKQTVKLMPGDFVTGRFDLMEMYNAGLKPSEKIKGEKTAFRWLETLEKGGFLTIKKTNKFSVVTIDNWAVYQQDSPSNILEIDQQMTIKRPSKDHQMTTNNNDNNVNNDSINKNIYTIFNHWNEQKIIVHKELNQKRKSAINARLENGYTSSSIIEAINNYSTVLKSDEYFFSYKWSLEDFMNPKNLDRFLNENDPLINFRREKKYGKPTSPSSQQHLREELNELSL